MFQRPLRQGAALFMAAFLGTAAFGHSPLEATTPANGATIAELPETLLLDFKGNIRLTRLTLTHSSDATVDLNLDAFSSFLSEFAVPLEGKGPGIYEFAWRGLGDDGHPLNGTFSFTVE